MSQHPDSHDIAEGVGSALKTSRVSVTDKRLWVIFGFVIIFALLSSVWQQHVVDGVAKNCQTISDGNANFNRVLTRLAASAAVNKTYTASERAQVAGFYDSLHLKTPHCSRDSWLEKVGL